MADEKSFQSILPVFALVNCALCDVLCKMLHDSFLFWSCSPTRIEKYTIGIVLSIYKVSINYYSKLRDWPWFKRYLGCTLSTTKLYPGKIICEHSWVLHIYTDLVISLKSKRSYVEYYSRTSPHIAHRTSILRFLHLSSPVYPFEILTGRKMLMKSSSRAKIPSYVYYH